MPSWLNPAQNVFESGQRGAAEFGRNFSQAFQEAHQEKLNAPLRQVQLEGEKLQEMNQTLNLQRNYSMMEADTVNKAGESAMATAISEISKTGSWTSDKAKAAVWDIASKYPTLVNTPVFKNTMMQFEYADKAKMQADAANQRHLDTVALNQDRIAIESARQQEQVRHDMTTEEIAKDKIDKANKLATVAFKVAHAGEMKAPTLGELEKLSASDDKDMQTWAKAEIKNRIVGKSGSKSDGVEHYKYNPATGNCDLIQ